MTRHMLLSAFNTTTNVARRSIVLPSSPSRVSNGWNCMRRYSLWTIAWNEAWSLNYRYALRHWPGKYRDWDTLHFAEIERQESSSNYICWQIIEWWWRHVIIVKINRSVNWNFSCYDHYLLLEGSTLHGYGLWSSSKMLKRRPRCHYLIILCLRTSIRKWHRCD